MAVAKYLSVARQDVGNQSISSCKMTHYSNMTKYHDKLALWHHDIVTISMDRQIFCLYLMKLESNVHFAIVHIQTKYLF